MSKQIKETKKEGTNKLTLESVKLSKDVIDKIIVSLPLLVELRILSSKLTSVPLEFSKLAQLKYLNLENNAIGMTQFFSVFNRSTDELPYNLPPNVTTIVLSRNNFSSFPTPLLYLPLLSHITLDHNNLTKIEIIVNEEKAMSEHQEMVKKETAPRRLTLFGRSKEDKSREGSLTATVPFFYFLIKM